VRLADGAFDRASIHGGLMRLLMLTRSALW
jgi:hypothetical protein